MKNKVVFKGRSTPLRVRTDEARYKMGPLSLAYVALGLVILVSVVYFCILIEVQCGGLELANMQAQIKDLNDEQHSLELKVAEKQRVSLPPTENSENETEGQQSSKTIGDQLGMVPVSSVSYLRAGGPVAWSR